jgi:hypothetical protein
MPDDFDEAFRLADKMEKLLSTKTHWKHDPATIYTALEIVADRVMSTTCEDPEFAERHMWVLELRDLPADETDSVPGLLQRRDTNMSARLSIAKLSRLCPTDQMRLIHAKRRELHRWAERPGFPERLRPRVVAKLRHLDKLRETLELPGGAEFLTT